MMHISFFPCIFLILLLKSSIVICWTDEDLQLFDLVENSDRKFYDILGVDQKASSNDIRKAYRRLSQQYHPDRNKEPGAEETFRKIAAIAEVLRNEEQRKKYDIILQTGLPDWREPIYYYRRVRNMGLFELIIFLFCLTTIGQYLFAWSVYWEKKYEFEEIFLSKSKKKNKHQRRGKNVKTADETEPSSLENCNLKKPRCQDLFPVQLVYLFISFVKSSPSYLKSSFESLQSFRSVPEEPCEEEEEEETFSKKETRPKTKKLEPVYPELKGREENGFSKQATRSEAINGAAQGIESKKIPLDSDGIEFKKALKKFPNGTLQRWEKIAEYLGCSVSEVVSLAKNVKSQQFSRNVPISAQGLTGMDDFASLDCSSNGKLNQNGLGCQNGVHTELHSNGSAMHRVNITKNDQANLNVPLETHWKQEEQRLLEIALQKYTKETPSRWDRIAEFIQGKTKEECIARYKWLAQEIRRKKDKDN